MVVTAGEHETIQCEMKHPCKTAPISHEAATDGRAVANLLRLPGALVGRVWPAERMVMGLRVAKSLRQELLDHACILLVKKGDEGKVNWKSFAKDLRRFSHLEVALKWKNQPAKMMDPLRLSSALLECKGLTLLDLSGSSIGDVGAGMLGLVLFDCHALAHVALNGVGIGHEGAFKLAITLGRCRALTHLALSGNHIGDVGAQHMASYLGDTQERDNALTHLELSHTGLGDNGAGSVAQLLRSCKALSHLCIRGNKIGDDAAGRLADALAERREGAALVSLALSYNLIGTKGVRRLARALVACKMMADLDLANNKIDDEGAGKLALVLGECKTLARLDLHSNQIGDEGAMRLAGMLGDSSVLAFLSLSSNKIGDAGVRALKKCKAPAHLDLSYNPGTTAGVFQELAIEEAAANETDT